jgi:hypothetical protein
MTPASNSQTSFGLFGFQQWEQSLSHGEKPNGNRALCANSREKHDFVPQVENLALYLTSKAPFNHVESVA